MATAVQTDRIDTDSLLNKVGQTPLIRLARVTSALPRAVHIYAKAEWFNPSGSVKDRPAANIIRHAIREGKLTPEKVLLDSTSGNMGISYATFAAALGYRVHLTVPENASPQRFSILKQLGAEITRTDPLEGSDGARIVAAEMAAEDPRRFFYADQYRNPYNWKSHYTSTGPEIVDQTNGTITHFVAGLGTSGTMMGCGRFLKERIPEVDLVAVQPDSALHGLEGLKDMRSSPPPEIYDPNLPDDFRMIRTEDAYQMARRLAKEEGLLVGISAAAAAQAALEIANELDSGTIVVIFPDSASKYLDLDFWNAGS